jgi:hypothetical protein
MSVRTKRLMVVLGIIVYAILQLDFWNWGKSTLLFGWWPIETFHHFVLLVVGGTLFVFLLISWGMPKDASEAIRRPEEESEKGGAK